MEIVNRRIKWVDDHNFQMAVSLRHISLNLSHNLIKVEHRIKRQCEALKHKSDLILKHCEKLICLKTQGYIEKVKPDETPVSSQVVYLPHFSTQQAKF